MLCLCCCMLMTQPCLLLLRAWVSLVGPRLARLSQCLYKVHKFIFLVAPGWPRSSCPAQKWTSVVGKAWSSKIGGCGRHARFLRKQLNDDTVHTPACIQAKLSVEHKFRSRSRSCSSHHIGFLKKNCLVRSIPSSYPHRLPRVHQHLARPEAP